MVYFTRTFQHSSQPQVLHRSTSPAEKSLGLGGGRISSNKTYMISAGYLMISVHHLFIICSSMSTLDSRIFLRILLIQWWEEPFETAHKYWDESTDAQRSMNPGPCASPGEPYRLGCFHCGCSWPGFGHELCGCKAKKKGPLLVQPYHTMSYHIIPCHITSRESTMSTASSIPITQQHPTTTLTPKP